MPWPADHPALTDPLLIPWSDALDTLCPDAEFVRILRHLPDRRVTSQIRSGHRDLVLKLFASPRARGNDRRLRLWKSSAVADLVPSPMGSDRTGHLGLIEFIPGEPMNQLRGDDFVKACELSGDALRRLHTSGVELDRAWTISEELDQLERRATPRAATAIAALIGLDFSGGGSLVSAHRDCHPGQAVVEGDVLRWIDLDDSAMAPAGLDVGNLIAHLRRYGAVGTIEPAVISRSIDAFRGAYGQLPEGSDVWEWLSLARLACLAEYRHKRSDEAITLLELLSELSNGLTDVIPPKNSKTAQSTRSSHFEVNGDVAQVLDEMGLAPTGEATLIPTGHADRPVYRVATSAGLVAAKFFEANRRKAPFRDHADLWNSPFGESRHPPGLPRPLGWVESRHCLVMEWLDGSPLARRGDPPPRHHLGEAASLLADLHSAGTRHRKTRDVEAILRSSGRKCQDLADTPIGELAREVLDTLAARLPEDDEFVPSHGDFSPRNLIVTPDGVRLIDFDRIQMADPARDVAYYGAWSWVTGLLFDGQSDWTINDEFLAAYLRQRPASRLGDQMSFHLAAALVRIVHGWTVLRQNPETARPVLKEALRILDGRGLPLLPR